jgi:2,4-dienoyl-CoA reductase-like NADH-dependent reductase (Old Yellow Enzyme family)
MNHCDEDGIVTDKLVEFYRERAKHKPGLIIVGGCYTEHLGMSTPTMIGISKDVHIEGLSIHKMFPFLHNSTMQDAMRIQLYWVSRLYPLLR